MLHDKYHLHLMISVWGKFDPGSPNNPDANFDTMNAKGYLYPAMGEAAHYYDPFNPGCPRTVLVAHARSNLPQRRGCLVAGRERTRS